jgi:Xaa-Pro aminopeptidase
MAILYKKDTRVTICGEGGTNYFKHLKKEKLQRLQVKMKEYGMGALLLYESGNIRYATGTQSLRFFTAIEWYKYFFS